MTMIERGTMYIGDKQVGYRTESWVISGGKRVVRTFVCLKDLRAQRMLKTPTRGLCEHCFNSFPVKEVDAHEKACPERPKKPKPVKKEPIPKAPDPEPEKESFFFKPWWRLW